MDWLIDYINTYNLWDALCVGYCQTEFKMSVMELFNYTYYEPVMNHLRYHYWEQLNILEVDND